jgi:hypothetical protein
MATVWTTTATALLFFLFTPLAQGEEAIQSKPAKEACESACLLGFKKTKLDGKDKELFNQCADQKFCSDPNTHYYVRERENFDFLRPYSFPSWVLG